jgi:hypothetical protein
MFLLDDACFPPAILSHSPVQFSGTSITLPCFPTLVYPPLQKSEGCPEEDRTNRSSFAFHHTDPPGRRLVGMTHFQAVSQCGIALAIHDAFDREADGFGWPDQDSQFLGTRQTGVEEIPAE